MIPSRRVFLGKQILPLKLRSTSLFLLKMSQGLGILFLLYSILSSSALRRHSVDIKNDIFKNYTNLFRPVLNESQPIQVTVNFLPRGINEFNEVDGRISVAMAIDVRWEDAFLKWNPARYGNVSTLVLPQEQIWTPNLASTIPIERVILFPEDQFKARIYNNGTIILIKAGTVQASCRPNVRNFPFDVHLCTVKVVPLNEVHSEVVLKAGLRMIIYENFGQWDVDQHRVYSVVLDVFSMVVYEFQVKRRASFSVVNFCVPVMILCVLNTLVFWIHPDSGERISYAITVFLSVVVFLTMMSETMPKNSDPVPIFSYILMAMMIESGLVVIGSVIGLHFNFRRNHQLPPRIRQLRERLGSLMPMADLQTAGSNSAVNQLTSRDNGNNTHLRIENDMSSNNNENSNDPPTDNIAGSTDENFVLRLRAWFADFVRRLRNWFDSCSFNASMFDFVCFIVSSAVFLITGIIYYCSIDAV